MNPIKNHTTHQLWLKQANHELLLKLLSKKLSKNEFKIIYLSFGIPLENINEDYQRYYINEEIA
ncbi:hypothetical protein M33023_00420 [Candidatus Phytoplasma asteris]|uniref:Uncharacterized protein n=1 Tax=Candidatus Phytoplasma asteris TaxID=85620 RepID=A0ABZ2YET2_9MOLU